MTDMDFAAFMPKKLYLIDHGDKHQPGICVNPSGTPLLSVEYIPTYIRPHVSSCAANATDPIYVWDAQVDQSQPFEWLGPSWKAQVVTLSNRRRLDEMDFAIRRHWAELYPHMKRFFNLSYSQIGWMVAHDGMQLEFVANPDEYLQMLAVKSNGEAIQFIDRPSEEIQLAAIAQTPHAIRHLVGKLLSVKVMEMAVRSHPQSIQWFADPLPELQALAVQLDPHVIRHIKDPCLAAQLAAVESDILTLVDIRNPHVDVQKLAVEKNISNIALVRAPHRDIVSAILDKNPQFIRFIPYSSLPCLYLDQEMIETACAKDPGVYVYLEKVAPKLLCGPTFKRKRDLPKPLEATSLEEGLSKLVKVV